MNPAINSRYGWWGILALLLVALVYGVARVQEMRRWERIPAGIYALGQRELTPAGTRTHVHLDAFFMQRTEVTVGQFVRYLNRVRPSPVYDSPQIEFQRRRYRARVERRQPVAYVDFAQARDYAAWLSRRRGRSYRLPTADEWEAAARGTTPGMPYPWGWAGPDGRAAYDLDGALRVAQFAPNRFGLYDLAGNVAEWVEPNGSTGAGGEMAYAMGGSWAERDPTWLWIARRPAFPRTYRDADVGFRLVREP